MQRSENPRLSGWGRALGAAALASALAATGSAQVSHGGKGGGLPGHGPAASGSKPHGSTGGSPLLDEQLIYHVLDRLTYGHTDADVMAVRQLGVDNWIRWQLEPANIAEDSTLTSKLAALPPAYTATGDPSWDWYDLYSDYLLRARYTTRQLNEVLTEFWSNHFDTGLQLTGGGRDGWYSSLAFDSSGNPAIGYYDAYNGRPRYVYWNGSSWIGNDPEGPRYTENGSYTSLAFDPVAKQPAMSYYDGRSNKQDLKFAKFNGATWAVEVVDSTGNVGKWTSLKYTSTGKPVIAYYDVTNQDLKLAVGPAPWTITTVDSGGDVGQYASLALDASDNPRVAYWDATNGAFKYASNNGASWSFQTIDPGPGVGIWGSLAINPGNGRSSVSYYDYTSKVLKFGELRGGNWNLTTVDTAGDVGQYSSLAFGPAPGNLPSIAYYDDAPRYDLKIAQFDGTTWTATGVDVDATRPQIAGQWASLAFDPSGVPNISYYNGSQFTLRRAFWNGTQWQKVTVDNPGQSRFLYTVWEKEETQAFRDKALGRFRDLLNVSATSPAMMLFLNNYENTASNGNENYGRELLELHTVAVDAGYTQTDVTTNAAAFTGWGLTPPSTRCDVQQGSFCYNHAAHDGTAKTVFNIGLPDDSGPAASNFMLQGNLMLDALARHPQTARFVCKKLIQKFVSDTPPERLWGECQSTFLASDGDMTAVMHAILLSPEFKDPATFLNKVRTPLEYTVAAVRHLEGDTDGLSMYTPIASQGMPLFRNAVPTGWSELGLDWISSNSFLQRWKWADQLTHQNFGTTVDPFTMVKNTGLDTAASVVEYFVQKLVRGQVSDVERGLLIDCVSNGSPSTFSMSDPNTPNRVRDTVDMVLGFPTYHKQ